MRSRLRFAAIIVAVNVGGILPGATQQLPSGGGPMPELQRGANGELKVVPAPRNSVPAPRNSVPAPTRPKTSPAGPSTAGSPLPPVADTVGRHYQLSVDALPAPNTTPPDDAPDPNIFLRTPGLAPRTPPGFAATVFAEHVGNARWLQVAPNGDVFLAASGHGKIMMLRDETGAGVATKITTFAAGLDRPHGMAFYDGALDVADVRAIWRFPYHDGDTVAAGPPRRMTVAADLRPTGHWTREIIFDQAGRLFLAIGAVADVAEEPPPAATVQQVGPDGGMTTFAAGLRNVVGLAVNPATGELWGTINERDRLGGGLPPDYLTRIDSGDFYGWPYAYVGPHPDPVFGKKRPDLVARTRVPDLLFEPHSAPLAVIFYGGAQFPTEYKGDAFVAFHCSGPYDRPDGYKIVRIRFQNGMPVGGYDDFVTGFMLAGTNPPKVWGTPAGLAVAKDGSLLVADEEAVWRIAYTGR